MLRKGVSQFDWSGGYDAAIPQIDDFGLAVVFDMAFDGERGIGFGFRLAVSRRTINMGCTRCETSS